MDAGDRHELRVSVRKDGVDAVLLVARLARRAGLVGTVEAPESKVVRPARHLEAVTPVLVDPVEGGFTDDGDIRDAVAGTGQTGKAGETVVSVEDVLVDGQVDHHLLALRAGQRLVRPTRPCLGAVGTGEDALVLDIWHQRGDPG